MNKINELLKFIKINPLQCGDGDGDSGGQDGSDQGASGGSGGSGVSSIDTNSPEFQNAVQSLLAKETDGLKKKNSELLDSLKQMKEQAKNFEGLDPEKVKNMMKVFAQNEEAQLIAEGKFDEVMQKRTDSLKEQFNDQVTTLKKQLEEARQNETTYKQQLDQNTIRQNIVDQALKAGVRKDAIDDVVRRAFDVFSVNEKGEIEARDKHGELLQNEDGLLLNPERFVSGLKQSHAYYWGESASGGSNGAGASGSGKNIDKRVSDLANSKEFDLEAYRKARKQQSGDNYHR